MFNYYANKAAVSTVRKAPYVYVASNYPGSMLVLSHPIHTKMPQS